MSKALSIFEQPKLNLPAHALAFQETESNIEARSTVPSLSYEGKVWTVLLNGEKKKITKRNEEGDEEPVAIMRVVVLDYNKRRGRAYYEGAYDPAKPGTPACWSDDGVKPDPKVEEPKASACDQCPLSARGSKVTENGKSVAACSQFRLVAVVPATKLDHPPLRMKLAITSDWDAQNKDLQEQGWFAFSNFTDMLRAKGINHTALIVTKMRFDPNVAYPKVLFSPDRFLDEETLSVVKPIVKGEEVKTLLAGSFTPGKSSETPEEYKAAAPKKAKAAAIVDDEDEAPVKKPAKKPAVVEDDDDEVVVVKKPAKKAAVIDDDEVEVIPPRHEPAKKVAKKAPVTIDADDEDEAPAPKKAKKAEPVKETKGTPEDVSSLLDEWEDA